MVPKEVAVSLLQRVLRANTVNPPGNELETALILSDFFDAHGIEVEVDEFLTGRANLIARLPGNDDPEGVFRTLSASEEPFAGRLKEKLADLHGYDLGRPRPEPSPELIFEHPGDSGGF